MARVSPLELAAAGLGVINIVLIVRRSAWNYPFGIAMVILYAMVFADARLYAAAGLQGFFLASQLYGWWYWRRSGGSGPVAVRHLAGVYRWWPLAAGALGTVALGVALSRWSDAAAPWPDAANASWSMVAQILTDRRHVESWPLWVAIDALSIGLYGSQGLYATAALYALFLIIALWGWRAWRAAVPQAGVAA